MVATAMRRRKTRKTPPAAVAVLRYTSKIIKAGALLPDAKTLLLHWDASASVEANLDRLRRENVFGKASRSRVDDILGVFRQRYLVEPEMTKALVALVKGRCPAWVDRILYFHSAQADALLRDFVTDWLVPLRGRGTTEIDPLAAERTLAKWASGGAVARPWSENTVRRVTQGLLSTLRDFGVLEGAVNKRVAMFTLPVQAFAYVAFYLKHRQPSGAKLVEMPDWKLFFLPPEGVERFLMEAHQLGLLEYHAAGTVTRLTFPADTLEEFAHVLVERPH